jgi:hypothetical protein
MTDKINVQLSREQACYVLETLTQEYQFAEPCFDDQPSLKHHITNMQTMLAISESLGIENWFRLDAAEMLERIRGPE